MPTVVNSYRLTPSFGGSGTYTITGVTSGNTLLVMFNLAGVNQPVVSVTDSQSGTYTEDLTFVGPNGETFYFYRRSNITNAPTSVTVDWTGNALVTCNIFEVSGLDNASPVDATATDTSSTPNSSPSKSITTITANAAVFGYLATANNFTFTPDSGWTALPASGNEFDRIVYDNDVGAAGSKTVSGTLSASSNWRWGVIAYKAAASGPSRPTSDITTTGWSASSGVVLFDMIDEASAADGDYIISPELGASPGPAVFALSPTLPAGNHQIDVRARRTSTAGQVRVILQDSGGTPVGTSAWQSLTASFATYTLGVTTTGTAERVSIEVQS